MKNRVHSHYFTLLGVIAALCQFTVDGNGQQVSASSATPTRVDAVWYDVPPNCLARRRAKVDELTAAHNRMPIGTLVRVTRLKNGNSVIVRITDRGITHTRAKIDLCREAAEQLDMIRAGITRVRLEIIPETAQENTAIANNAAAP